MRLKASGIPFLIGGAFAYARYSGVDRPTKDLDIFLRPTDVPAALTMFQQAGYRTELPFPHWLGKIHSGEHFMDVIFGSGNGIAEVDSLWFEYAVEDAPQIPDDWDTERVPLASLVRGSGTTPTRLVVFRRPIEHRSPTRADLELLVVTVVVFAVLRRLCDRLGLTLVLIDHVMRVVMGVSDRITVLNHGRRLAEGTPESVRRDPAVVAAYLGRAPHGA